MNKTLAKVGYAPMETTTDGKIDYKDIIWFKSSESGGREVTAEPNGETATIYADGLPVIIAEENSGYNVKVALLAIIDDIEENWLGNEKTDDGGVLERNKTAERPRFALVVGKERFKGQTTYEIDTYFNCMISKRPSRSDKTSEGKFDPQFPEFEIAASPREDNKFVRHTTYANTLPTKIVLPTIDGEATAPESAPNGE